MSEDEPSFFNHGLGPRPPREKRPAAKQWVRVQPEGIARYGHGLGPRSPKFIEVEGLDSATPLSREQKRTLTIALLTLGAVSIGTLALIETIRKHNCEQDPQGGACDRTGSSSHGGGGGSGGSYGHSVSYGGFGSSGSFHFGGGS